ncbi:MULTISPECIES: AbrB family transcriptional regulator [Pseudomonas]|uniref:AbrB family transcriptional regulator n=1 Tax=Pseudomonas sp. M2 TaxID=228756 RepID=UPI00157265F0|nr:MULTISPECIES: AbrB family transcriptional regulator [Pseudomonas]MBG6128467.1 membrane AbrB-like protein [Pseudomonas sp. M2]NSX19589.1 AbrB family transcriptional regulator [Pseudomonas putida]HDS1746088.1 AbrB family transcriptional regulator [Pseudomonas putida]
MQTALPGSSRTPTLWLALLTCAGACGQLLHAMAVPAGLFLGPMLVAIAFGVSGARLSMHRQVFRFGQGCVGLLVAHSVTWAVLVCMAHSWHMMLVATFITVALSALVGLGTVRFGGIPGSTAAWGTAPGAASAMVSMAEENGADARVVATMQYVRVVCVVMIGALVSHLLGATPGNGAAASSPAVMQSLNLFDTVLSVGVVLFGMLVGSRMPAGALLMPLLLGGALQLGGVLTITLPAPLLAFAYGAIGCYIGLRFDRQTVRYVWKRLPTMIAGAMALIILCAACAWVLAMAMDTDFLSMYLATSPGGLDAMAIIAVETHADVGLVLAMQTLRLFGVILTGAFCARQIIRMTQA